MTWYPPPNIDENEQTTGDSHGLSNPSPRITRQNTSPTVEEKEKENGDSLKLSVI